MMNKLALKIDAAIDQKDTAKLQDCLKYCQKLINNNTKPAATLYFYKANCYSALQAYQKEHESFWHSMAINQILCLRKAINSQDFNDIPPIIKCKIFTNLANTLRSVGRPIAANTYYDKALNLYNNFGMAIGNKAVNLYSYAIALYEPGHLNVFMHHANIIFKKLKNTSILWDSENYLSNLREFEKYQKKIQLHLNEIQFDLDFDYDQFSLGDDLKEKEYRQWCLENRLFLSPLNDITNKSIAAYDILNLPDHRYSINEDIRFPKYFNILKQEFITARYMAYESISDTAPSFVNKEVLLFNNFDGIYYGYKNELLKNSLRISYSIFDKIALFIDDYLTLNLDIRKTNFRNIWGSYCNKNKKFIMRDTFLEKFNPFFNGLYFLSKDIYLDRLNEVAEPAAKEINKIRNFSEHRYLGIQEWPAEIKNTKYIKYITEDDLREKTIMTLKLAREALVYLTLAMAYEEGQRVTKLSDNELTTLIHAIPLVPPN